jgi:hypothetical protein
MSTCKTCKLVLDISKFEIANGKPRGECKVCRKNKRANAKKAAPIVEPNLATKPTECTKCELGPPEVDFKWRTDTISGGWRSVCNACYGEKKYHVACRDRKRAEDEDAYLAHNNEMQRAWQKRNPDVITNQVIAEATVVSKKIRKIKATAKYKKLEFDDGDMEAMAAKLDKECNYCGFTPAEGEFLNGLDRVESTMGYTDDNTVTCCAACNAIKGSLTETCFVHKVMLIYKHRRLSGVTMPEERIRPVPFGGTAERRAADPHPKDNSLSDDKAFDLWCSPCYLCEQSPSFGIDRVDSSKPYIDENVESCCTECNYMKKDMELYEFEKQIVYIARHMEPYYWWDGPETIITPILTLAGVERIPVAATFQDMELIFPSRAIAVKMLKKDVRKCTMSTATPSEFRAQYMTYDEVMDFITAVTNA